jgi:hypothetical protein
MDRQLQQRSKQENTGKIIGHVCTYFLSFAMTIWSGENPRILIYAHGFSTLYRLIAVWMVALAVDKNGSKGSLGERFTREPKKWEQSKPWQDNRTRAPAGITTYIVVVFTLLFTVGVVLCMGSGAEFLSRKVLIPEVSWAIFIALIYIVDDLASKQLVVSSNKPLPINLGYNVGGLNFLIAAVFISAFLLVTTINITVWFFGNDHPIIFVEWLILIILSTIRLFYDILWREKRHTHNIASKVSS